MDADEDQQSARPVRVVVVDDSEVLLETLEAALGLQPGVEVVAAVARADAAVDAVSSHGPDVVLLDLRLGDSCGLDLVPALRAGVRPPAIVVFSADPKPIGLDPAAGVHAQVVKGAPVHEIAAALIAAAASAVERGAGPQS